ncbi:MAG: hypothetical protein JJ897_10580 [Marinibacterium sp.]|nr:hypothetical protein [Marinibacterium sp.]
MLRAAVIICLPLAACDLAQTGPDIVAVSDYLGIQTSLLDGDLVQFGARLRGGDSPEPAAEYAECAAAQYALIRGYGFARHLRTNVTEEAGIWTADAVYTISPSLPPGLRTIDAEVVVAACAENGIPTV